MQSIILGSTNMNIQNIIWGLEELADRDFQERVWLGNSENEMSSFTEAVCTTFDDTGLSVALASKNENGQISTEFREKAIHLRRLLKDIDESLGPRAIITHPKMAKVRDAAKEMLRILNA